MLKGALRVTSRVLGSLGSGAVAKPDTFIGMVRHLAAHHHLGLGQGDAGKLEVGRLGELQGELVCRGDSRLVGRGGGGQLGMSQGLTCDHRQEGGGKEGAQEGHDRYP